MLAASRLPLWIKPFDINQDLPKNPKSNALTLINLLLDFVRVQTVVALLLAQLFGALLGRCQTVQPVPVPTDRRFVLGQIVQGTAGIVSTRRGSREKRRKQERRKEKKKNGKPRLANTLEEEEARYANALLRASQLEKKTEIRAAIARRAGRGCCGGFGT